MPYAPEKYLLPTERTVIRVRRHWAILASDGLQALGLVALAGLVSVVGRDTSGAQWLAWWLVLTAALRFAFVCGEWFVERFVVTDMRVIMTSGIITRKVAMMPLVKVTDMTYERSVLGQLLGYGGANSAAPHDANMEIAQSSLHCAAKRAHIPVKMRWYRFDLLAGGRE